ncbi:RNI-like protein [Auriscalpium vulgare]|uniref:RNI-like protein n=1 Tax=Auriscalpium vulgare TaxID=40419 RepID=A0ACB8S237_9AGAM|nr:RNI-like protein [Auriscalpium vulgare]
MASKKEACRSACSDNNPRQGKSEKEGRSHDMLVRLISVSISTPSTPLSSLFVYPSCGPRSSSPASPPPSAMFYNLQSPAQSTTSLSDNDDDDLNQSTFFNASTDPLISTPATWSSRLHTIAPPTAPPAHSPASSLPPEILINILKHLHSARDIHHTLLVSRAWAECSVELLWHKPTVNDFNTLIKIMQVLSREDRTFTYAQFIRRLNLANVGTDLSDNIFQRLSQCTRLERITLVGCSSLTDDAIARTVAFFPNLVAIDLSTVDSVTNQTVVALANHCRKLQGINLLGCRRVTSSGVRALADSCPLLRRVKLSGVMGLNDTAVSALSIKSSLLLEIDLNGCRLITDNAVRDVWTHAVNMREMRLSQCVEVTDAGFPAPHNSREPLPTGANPFHDSAAIKLATMELPPLRLSRPFEHLRMLDLTNCAKITDDAVEGIIQSAPRIRNLVLSKCNQLTDRAVESICLLGKHLHYLHLGHASSITDRSVKTLARACTRLRYIDLASACSFSFHASLLKPSLFTDCNELTDMSVFELASLPKLRRIGLVRVNNLTDEAIYALGDRHATLERVHLSYCDQISVMAVHFLLQKLHKLNHLSLTGVPTFRRPELQQFCRNSTRHSELSSVFTPATACKNCDGTSWTCSTASQRRLGHRVISMMMMKTSRSGIMSRSTSNSSKGPLCARHPHLHSCLCLCQRRYPCNGHPRATTTSINHNPTHHRRVSTSPHQRQRRIVHHPSTPTAPPTAPPPSSSATARSLLLAKSTGDGLGAPSSASAMHTPPCHPRRATAAAAKALAISSGRIRWRTPPQCR